MIVFAILQSAIYVFIFAVLYDHNHFCLCLAF